MIESRALSLSLSLSLYIYIYVYVYTYMHTNICVCVYIYIYIYIYLTDDRKACTAETWEGRDRGRISPTSSHVRLGVFDFGV